MRTLRERLYWMTSRRNCISVQDSLRRIFKEQAEGQSFSEILEHVRLEAVCRKLIDTNWSIDKIAIHEGFSSGSYLHTVFRKRYGYTPSTYRAMNVKL